MPQMLIFRKKEGRRAFILYLVCAIALALAILVFGLNFLKRGVVFQLSKTIEQEKMIGLAQAGINEMLAEIKTESNDLKSPLGKAIFDFWKSQEPIKQPTVLKTISFSHGDLIATNRLTADFLGSGVEVTGKAEIVVSRSTGKGRPSYLGHIQLVSTVNSGGIQNRIRVKERRELKIVDLADPFLDKYALFVKSFCESINNPQKRLVIQGIQDQSRYSFIYLGNRSYPKCREFPSGAQSSVPPTILDLDFKEDRNLLGSFPNPGGFNSTDGALKRKSEDSLFWRSPAIGLKNYVGKFSVHEGFHKLPEFRELYSGFVDSCKSAAQAEGSVQHIVVNDYNTNASGGKTPENAKIFRNMIDSLLGELKYHYGYSDYTRIFPSGNQFTVSEAAFSGILDYFKSLEDQNSPIGNPQKLRGGKMPLLFGQKRDTCVYIEGPVLLRFFKVAFLDECTFDMKMFGGSTPIPFPAIRMAFEKPQATFVGQPGRKLDKFTDTLMSHAVEIPINSLFFSGGQSLLPTTVDNSPIQGYDVFPKFEPSLKTVSHFYQNAVDFINHRVKKDAAGNPVINLDGISLIVGLDGKPLDLTQIANYQGKGTLVIYRGHCKIGNLLPYPDTESSLKIYLMNGRFLIPKASSEINIRASLAATSVFVDNSRPDVAREGGIWLGGGNVTITGNLIVDNLFEFSELQDGKSLKIIHDPGLFFPDYPVRVSIGQVKSAFALDYQAGDG